MQNLLSFNAAKQQKSPHQHCLNLGGDYTLIKALQEELLALSPEDLNARLTAEQAKERQELIEKADREEKARFFNRSSANADFSHWSKATYWTLDEAIALSFGKAPEVVKWESVQSLVGVSPFAFQY